MMTKFQRTILVWFFSLLFCFTFPLLVFYSLGWRVDLEKKKFVQVGGVAIEANQNFAKVFLDKKEKGKTNFLGKIFLRNLFPKKYHLKIEKEKFFPFEREIEIKSGEALNLKVELFPKLNFSTTTQVPETLLISNQENLPLGKDEIAKIKKEGMVFSLDKFGNLKKDSEILNFKKLFIPEKEKPEIFFEGKVIFVKIKDEFFFLREGIFEKIEKPIKGITSFETEIVLFSDKELYLFFPQEKEFLFLYRFEDEIKKAIFIDRYYLLVLTQNKIFAFEKRPNGNLYLVFENQEIKDVFYDKEKKTVYVKVGANFMKAFVNL